MQSEVIAHSGRNIEAGAFVEIRLRPFVPEDILPVVCSEWSGIFPLRICGSIAFADRDPSAFASRNGRSLIRFSEPGNNIRRFGPMALPRFVIVWQRAVKRIQPWGEFYRNIIAAMRRIRVIHPTVIFSPLVVP